MKQSIKISVMAIAAMFAFTTVANAQFGLLKKAVKEVFPEKKKSVQTGQERNHAHLTLPGTDKKVMAIVPASYTVKSYEAFEGQAWEDKDFMARAKAAIEKKYPTPDNARKGQLKAKLAEIGTRDDHWRYSRNSLGVILDRYIHVYAVYEFEDGEVYLTEFYAVQNNNGAGYDDNIVVNYSSRYGDVKYSIEKWEAKTDIFTSKIGK